MTSPNMEQARFNMAEQQIRPWDVSDTKVLDILQTVPRENFVPHAYKGLAFADTEIPIGEGQHMMEPKMEARKSLGLRVLIFLLILGFLVYLTKKKIWRDVEH